MNVKEISPMKMVIGISIGAAILYSLHLGHTDVALAGIAGFAGYLAKDIETTNDGEEEA